MTEVPQLRVRVWSLAVLAGLVATVSLSACSSGSTDAAKAKASQQVVAASIAPTHAQRAIPPDSQIVEVPALRKTIALTSCQAASGGWAGAGTAHNPGTAERTYHIMVFFNDKYSRTVDYATTSVKVAAGSTANWTAAAKFVVPAGTQCVLRGLSQT